MPVRRSAQQGCRLSWLLFSMLLLHLKESIRLRNPYVDALNFIQVHFLREWRRQGDPQLLNLLRLTIHGIASGMKSTG